MATIAKLVLRIEAELRPLTNQLRDASRQVTKFGADVSKAFSQVPKLDKLVLGGAAVSSRLAAVEKDFEKTFGSLRRAAKKGVINPDQFSDELIKAVRAAKGRADAITAELLQAGEISRRQAQSLTRKSTVAAEKAELGIVIGQAQRAVTELENRFRAQQTTATHSRAIGGTGPREFAALARQDADAFNQALAAKMKEFADQGKLTEPLRQAMARQFKRAGFGFDPREITIAKSIDAAEKGASAFVRQYQQTVQSAKFGNLTGDLTGKQFKKALDDANKELSRGLKTVRDTLERDGLLTPEALKFLNAQFQRAGATTAGGFFEAFDKAMSEGSIRSLQRFGTVATQVGSTLTKFLTVPITGAAIASVKLAGDAEQANRKLESTFGPFAVDLSRKLAGLRKDIPATSAELTNMAATFGELLIPLKIAPSEVAKMSVELIKAAKNVAVFRGVSTERGFNAIVNALVGQSRELKKLGIEIDDRTIRDEAYRKGIARIGAQLSTTQKVMAGYSVIMQRTGLVANTLQDQQNTFNVRLLFFVASVKEAGIALGSTLLPAITRIVIHVTTLADRFALLSDSAKRTTIILAAVGAALGPTIIAIGFLARTVAILRASYFSINALTGQTGLTALLGISAGTIVEILGVAAVIAGLVAEIKRYKEMMNTTTDVSDDFIRSIKGMTAAELAHAAVQRDIELGKLIRQQRELSLRAGLQVLQGDAGPIVSGGTLKDRQEFQSLGDAIVVVNKELGLLRDEMKTVADFESRMAKEQEKWNKRVTENQANVQNEVLVETLAKARQQYRLLNVEATAATIAIKKGTTIHDDQMVARGVTRAKEALSAVEALNAQFKQLRLDPEFQVAGKEIGELVTKTEGLKDRLTALLATAENSKALTDFTTRLALIRKELQTGAVTGDVATVSAAFGQMQSLQEELQTALTEATKNGQVAMAARIQTMSLEIDRLKAKFNDFVPEQFFKRIDTIIDELKLLKESAGEGVITSTGIPLDQFDKADEKVRDLIVAQAELLSEIVQRKTLGQDTLKQEQELLKVTKAIKDATPNLFDRLFGNDFIPRIQTVANALRDATSQEDAAKAIGDTKAAIDAHLNVVRAQVDLGKLTADFRKSIAGLDSKSQALALKGFSDAFRKANGEASDFGDNVDKATKRLLRMGAVVNVIRQIADMFGLTGENITKSIQAAGVLLTSLESLKRVNDEIRTTTAARNATRGASNPFAAPVGPTFEQSIARVSAVVGIVVSAFNLMRGIVSAFSRHESELQQEQNEIIRQNSLRLEEATEALRGFTLSIGNQIRVAQAVSDPAVQHAAVARAVAEQLRAAGNSNVTPGDVTNSRQRLEQELARFGLTFADINRIAKENGIQLLDSKGRLVAGAFDQLVKSISIARESFFVWADTLDEQQKKIDVFNNVFNVPDTGEQQVQDQLFLLNKLAPDLFKQFFSGIDLNDATALENALQIFTQALLDGSLEASESLKLLNKDEVIKIITDMANGFDKLREATDELTKSELNVPTWFKRAQVTFESVNATLENKTPPVMPGPLGPPTQGGPDNPPPPDARGGDIFVNGPLIGNVSQQPGESTEDFVDRVVAKLRRRQFLTTGSSSLKGFE